MFVGTMIMSGGRKFTSDSLLSAEERLDEIERKYSVIQERIQAYDVIIREFEDLKKQLKQFHEQLDYLYKINEKESENILRIIRNNTTQIEEVRKINEKNIEMLYEFGNNHRIQVNEINGKINDHKLSLESLYKQEKDHFKRIDIINENTLLLKSSFKGVQADIESFSSSMEKLNSNYSLLKNEFAGIQQKSNESMEKFSSSLQKIPDFKDWAAQVLIKSDASLDEARSELTNKIEHGIQSVRKELREDPLTVNFIKKEFKNVLESLSLDSKNAYLKSNNCAQQIQILEKKIETINLTLKKYELSK